MRSRCGEAWAGLGRQGHGVGRAGAQHGKEQGVGQAGFRAPPQRGVTPHVRPAQNPNHALFSVLWYADLAIRPLPGSRGAARPPAKVGFGADGSHPRSHHGPSDSRLSGASAARGQRQRPSPFRGAERPQGCPCDFGDRVSRAVWARPRARKSRMGVATASGRVRRTKASESRRLAPPPARGARRRPARLTGPAGRAASQLMRSGGAARARGSSWPCQRPGCWCWRRPRRRSPASGRAPTGPHAAARRRTCWTACAPTAGPRMTRS